MAEVDLVRLCDFVEKEAGEAVAIGFFEKIEAACLSLETHAERGLRRDDLLPGLRTLAIERRVLIAYRVLVSKVVIVRIFYGGRHFERVLRGRKGKGRS
ncbi:toxin ParE1/3/4 [Amphiplicatus metriothermophilus]|uniref:Toxin ParE1/3/4 n=2 Tax=Amphiplicatus metriothermophilus TaxID=1519374 RepID=A0A239PPS0_9PROT|nr:toxin ParE1/3/4 [Amphiplicatus metriothermophilus]SNT72138.1 toxin ParE1/3/4 [Amphiplicatus metriothermophilus]